MLFQFFKRLIPAFQWLKIGFIAGVAVGATTGGLTGAVLGYISRTPQKRTRQK